jgi:hypothetical protein
MTLAKDSNGWITLNVVSATLFQILSKQVLCVPQESSSSLLRIHITRFLCDFMGHHMQVPPVLEMYKARRSGGQLTLGRVLDFECNQPWQVVSSHQSLDYTCTTSEL